MSSNEYPPSGNGVPPEGAWTPPADQPPYAQPTEPFGGSNPTWQNAPYPPASPPAQPYGQPEASPYSQPAGPSPYGQPDATTYGQSYGQPAPGYGQPGVPAYGQPPEPSPYGSYAEPSSYDPYATPQPNPYGAYQSPAEYNMITPYPTPGRNSQSNGLGIAALICGIASWFCFGLFTGIPAIICGVLGRKAADEGRANNKGLATAGLVLGIVGAIGTIFIWIAIATS